MSVNNGSSVPSVCQQGVCDSRGRVLQLPRHRAAEAGTLELMVPS